MYEKLLQIPWSDDLFTQYTISAVILLAITAAILVYAPLYFRLWRLRWVARKLRRFIREHRENPTEAQSVTREYLGRSLLAPLFHDFLFRWRAVQIEGRSTTRFADLTDQTPLLPVGWRRSLLGSVPGIFLAVGILGTFIGLTLALDDRDQNLQQLEVATPSTIEDSQEDNQAKKIEGEIDQLITSLSLAFRTSLWGITLSILFAIAIRSLEGGFDSIEERLDHLIHRIFPWISEAEVSGMSLVRQREGTNEIKTALQDMSMSLENAISAGLERIEKTASEASNVVSEELIGKLETTIQEGVGAHVEALREAIEKTTAAQEEIGESIALAFEEIRKATETHATTAENLSKASAAVDAAAEHLSKTATEFGPVVDNFTDTSASLKSTAEDMQSIQKKTADVVDVVKDVLTDAGETLKGQRELVEQVLGEMNSSIQQLSEGLADNLVNALENIDGILGDAVGKLNGTIHDSNEMLDRMTPAIQKVLDLSNQVDETIKKLDGGIEELGGRINTSLTPLPDSLRGIKVATDALANQVAAFKEALEAQNADDQDTDDDRNADAGSEEIKQLLIEINEMTVTIRDLSNVIETQMKSSVASPQGTGKRGIFPWTR